MSNRTYRLEWIERDGTLMGFRLKFSPALGPDWLAALASKVHHRFGKTVTLAERSGVQVTFDLPTQMFRGLDAKRELTREMKEMFSSFKYTQSN